MLNALPLSWARTTQPEPKFNLVKLPLSRRNWISTADVPFNITFNQIYRDVLSTHCKGFVIRGCNQTLSRYLRTQQCQVAQTGVEAVLNLRHNNMARRSLLELVRRGKRWGNIQEIQPTTENRQKLARFIAATTYGAKPRLRYAFRAQFDETARCFVLATPKNEWLGAITLSLMNRSYVHTELLLRRKSAPVGIMEALVATIYETLKQEGYSHWSLGEAPFVSDEGAIFEIPCSSAFTLSCRAFFLKLRRVINFGYNFEGLFRFKNKFSPEWRPLYLCGKPDLSWLVLLDLSIQTRYLHLFGSELYYPLRAKIRNYSG